MINRHAELRTMAQTAMTTIVHMNPYHGLAYSEVSTAAIALAKQLQSALDAECSASGHTFARVPAYTESSGWTHSEKWGPCTDCGKEKEA